MKRLHLSKLMFLLVPLLSLVLMTAQVTSAAPVNDGGWKIVKSPNGSFHNNLLSGTVAISNDDVWAVGATYNGPEGPPLQALIEHWNGARWSIVQSPNPGRDNVLYGLAAVSANDVWAVGTTTGGSFGTPPIKTLIEHWNGTQWSILPSPNPGFTQSVLYTGVAISTKSVWAVGFSDTSSGSTKTLVEHWNGSQWSVVKSPNSGSSDFFNNVTAVSANDIWAVGNGGSATIPQTLVEHWNGSQWSIVPSPNVGTNGDFLIGVSVISESNIWAVGAYLLANGNTETLVEYWNGAQWNVVKSPNVGSHGSILNSVAAISATDIWAVGDYVLGNGNTQNLIEHWNGARWSIVQSPNTGSGGDQLGGVAAVSADDVWAIGTYIDLANAQQLTLIEHCC